MKLQLESYGKKFTVETDYDDVSIFDYFEMFKGLLIQATFNPATIDDAIKEIADDLDIDEYKEIP